MCNCAHCYWNQLGIMRRHMFVCFLHSGLASFIAIQPELTGSRSKHSVTITSRPLEDESHLFCSLLASFLPLKFSSIYKPQCALQRLPSAEHVRAEGPCSVWMPSNLLPVKSVPQISITECLCGFWSPRTDKEEERSMNYGSYAHVLLHLF